MNLCRFKCRLCAGLLIVITAPMLCGYAQAATLDLSSATIAEIQYAMGKGLSSERLTGQYLKRIEAYDKAGPKIKAVITLNPKAMELARELDAERAHGNIRGPLHGIPVVLKDNIDTFDLPTTGGSILLEGSIPPDDAFIVKKLREAGAIILAKVNLSEFASGSGGPDGFSSMGGQTHNPHDLARGPAGSSGGTGAAIAAGFAQFGLGTDTGGSVRSPSSVNGIVGLKPTNGLLSRDGIIPLTLSYDTAGPMARSVYDIALALNVMKGVDPADAATQPSAAQAKTDYTQSLQYGALKGARIGVARQYMGVNKDTDAIVEKAIATLRNLGATVIDPITFPDTVHKARSAILEPIGGREFRVHLNEYLATLAPGFPKTLAELIARAEAPGSAYNNPWRLKAMKKAQAKAGDLDNPHYLAARNHGMPLIHDAVMAVFLEHQLDAFIYPTRPEPALLIPPRPEEPPGTPPSGRSIANHAGLPDLIVPAGMTPNGLPVTISFIGPRWSEARLLGFGYEFDKMTNARRLPKHTPMLAGDLVTY